MRKPVLKPIAAPPGSFHTVVPTSCATRSFAHSGGPFAARGGVADALAEGVLSVDGGAAGGGFAGSGGRGPSHAASAIAADASARVRPEENDFPSTTS